MSAEQTTTAPQISGPYRFTLAWIIGLSVTMVHIATAGYLWFVFRHHPSFTNEISAPEVTLPLTVAYMLTIAKWFIDTKGIRQSDLQYGWPVVVFFLLIVVSFLICLPLGPYLYMAGEIRDPQTLNDFYLFVETVLGGVFALIFGELFGASTQKKDD